MRKIVLKVDRKHSALENASVILDQGKQQMIFILLFTVLYLLRDLADMNIPDIVFSGLCAVAFIVMDMGTSLGVYMFTTALTVPHNEITIVYLGIITGKIFFSGKAQLNGRLLAMNLGLMVLQLLNITLFSTDTVADAIYDYGTRMMILIAPLFWFNDDYNAEDFRSALMCYVAGVMLGGTVTLILTAERVSWEALLKGTGDNRLGKTYKTDEGMQTTYNANQLAVMFAIASAVILQHMDQKRINNILSIAILGYAMFLTVLTRSRTGLLMMAFVIAVYYLVLVIRRKRWFSSIILLSTVAATVFLIMHFIPDVVERVMNRFVGQEDISNGRIEIFVLYIQKWVETPWCFLFGYGMGSVFDELGISNSVSPHNAIADILISWGLVGFLLVVGILSMCFRKGLKGVDKKNRIMALLPAMVALISSMAGQYLDTGYPHPRLCFLLLAAQAFAAEEQEPVNKKRLLQKKT